MSHDIHAFCWVVKIVHTNTHVSMHGMSSNYVRYWSIPRSLIWNCCSSKLNSPWIILMTASHTCINTLGNMYARSVLHAQIMPIEESLVVGTMAMDFKRHFWCEQSSSTTPYESMYKLLSKDATVLAQNQSPLYCNVLKFNPPPPSHPH